MSQSVRLSETTTVQYWTYHDEKKPTIVMIHGFTGSHEGFHYLVPQLDRYRLIIPDLPGFGTSTIGREDWSIDAIAQLLNDFVASLRLEEPPYLLGHSMGGLVASSMLAQAPQGLYRKKAILLSPVPTAIRLNDARRPGFILGALQYRLGARSGRAGERLVKNRMISRALTRFIMTTSDRKLRREIYQHHFKNLEFISSVEYYSKLYTDINRRGAIDYAARLRPYKLLLITGNADAVTPLKEQKKFINAAGVQDVVILKNVGHLAHYERASEIAAAIRRYLA